MAVHASLTIGNMLASLPACFRFMYRCSYSVPPTVTITYTAYIPVHHRYEHQFDVPERSRECHQHQNVYITGIAGIIIYAAGIPVMFGYPGNTSQGAGAALARIMLFLIPIFPRYSNRLRILTVLPWTGTDIGSLMLLYLSCHPHFSFQKEV